MRCVSAMQIWNAFCIGSRRGSLWQRGRDLSLASAPQFLILMAVSQCQGAVHVSSCVAQIYMVWWRVFSVGEDGWNNVRFQPVVVVMMLSQPSFLLVCGWGDHRSYHPGLMWGFHGLTNIRARFLLAFFKFTGGVIDHTTNLCYFPFLLVFDRLSATRRKGSVIWLKKIDYLCLQRNNQPTVLKSPYHVCLEAAFMYICTTIFSF
jgi:hypothetical protein